jgi:hypothetical protein
VAAQASAVTRWLPLSTVLDKIGSRELNLPANIPLLATERAGALIVQVDNDSPAGRAAKRSKKGLLLQVIRSGSMRFIAVL